MIFCCILVQGFLWLKKVFSYQLGGVRVIVLQLQYVGFRGRRALGDCVIMLLEEVLLMRFTHLPHFDDSTAYLAC